MKNKMNIIAILSKVPWNIVIENTPSIIDKGKEIISSLKRGESKDEAIENMAQLLNEQAQLIETLSEQNRQLFEAAKTLAIRQRILFGIAITSFLLAAGTCLDALIF
jgi:ABC-type sugar transport system ATPase subunit